MLFLVDANMPRSTMTLLAQLDHQAEFVRDTNLFCAPDTQIAARARDAGAVLITRDMDFADIRNYPPLIIRALLYCDYPMMQWR